MKRFILAAMMVIDATQGSAQAPQQPQQQPAGPPAERTYSEADLWERGSDRITFRLANISFPVTAGPARLARIVEASHPGQGLDNALQYYSPDEQVFVTVYVYAPAFPDAGLTAFMTDHVIHLTSGRDLRILRSGPVAAGGRAGVALRTDYAGARQERLASSAAFLQIDHWIVKLRASGPEARRAEVESAMTALLEGLRFPADRRPRPVRPPATAECPRQAGPAARLMPADAAETMEDAIMSHVLGREVQARRSANPDNGPSWCPAGSIRLPDMAGPTPILRTGAGAAAGETRRSLLVALVADNGTILEVVERTFHGRTRFVVQHHQIGRTLVLGAYDREPTEAQLRAILTGEDREGGQARATVTYQASGDSTVTIHVAPDAAPTPPTT